MTWQQTFRALRHRNYRLFFAGQIISLVGTWMQNLALAWLLYRMTHSEFVLGLSSFCSNIGVLLLGPLGGVVADRYSRHRVVVIAQALSLLQAAALATLVLSGRANVPALLALGFTLGLVNAFEIPARQALVPQLVEKEDLLNAISLNSAMFNAARIIGPSIAGALVAMVGEGWCFALNAASFVAVIGCLLAMRLAKQEAPPAESAMERLRGGIAYLRASQPVRSVLILMAAGTFAIMPVMVLAPVIADGVFHRGAAGLGMLSTATGLGAVAGTLALARRGGATGLRRVVFWSSSALAISLVLYAASPTFAMALGALLCIGFAVMRQNAGSNTFIQTTVPDQYRGRIMAFYSMTVVGLSPIAGLAAGSLAHHVGARWTIATGALICATSALVFRYALRSR